MGFGLNHECSLISLSEINHICTHTGMGDMYSELVILPNIGEGDNEMLEQVTESINDHSLYAVKNTLHHSKNVRRSKTMKNPHLQERETLRGPKIPQARMWVS